MKNGYVVPPRNKRIRDHAHQMSFATYLQLRMFFNDRNIKPNNVVTSHDQDKMSYLEGFHAFNMVKRASEEDLRLISGLISLLYTKHVITKDEEIKFVKNHLRSLRHEQKEY